jgi:hypothetical protein
MSSSPRSEPHPRWVTRAVMATMVAVSAMSVRPASAAALECRIPFSFVVNDTTLPAGTYRVDASAAQGLLEVRDMRHGAFALGIALDDRRTPETKLVFHRYGDQYVLREVWMGEGVGRELPEPPLERALTEGMAGRPAAQLERIEVPAL